MFTLFLLLRTVVAEGFFCVMDSEKFVRITVLSTKFPHQEIRWNFHMLRSDWQPESSTKIVLSENESKDNESRQKWTCKILLFIVTQQQKNSTRCSVSTKIQKVKMTGSKGNWTSWKWTCDRDWKMNQSAKNL